MKNLNQMKTMKNIFNKKKRIPNASFDTHTKRMIRSNSELEIKMGQDNKTQLKICVVKKRREKKWSQIERIIRFIMILPYYY